MIDIKITLFTWESSYLNSLENINGNIGVKLCFGYIFSTILWIIWMVRNCGIERWKIEFDFVKTDFQ